MNIDTFKHQQLNLILDFGVITTSAIVSALQDFKSWSGTTPSEIFVPVKHIIELLDRETRCAICMNDQIENGIIGTFFDGTVVMTDAYMPQEKQIVDYDIAITGGDYIATFVLKSLYLYSVVTDMQHIVVADSEDKVKKWYPDATITLVGDYDKFIRLW